MENLPSVKPVSGVKNIRDHGPKRRNEISLGGTRTETFVEHRVTLQVYLLLIVTTKNNSTHNWRLNVPVGTYERKLC